MKIRQTQNVKKCSVIRCKGAPFEEHIYPDGAKLRFCKRHGHEAAKEAGELGVSIDIRSLVIASEIVLPGTTPRLPEPEILTAEESEKRGAIQKAHDKSGGAIATLFTAKAATQMRADIKEAETELAELQTLTLTTTEEAIFGEQELARVRDFKKTHEKQRTKVTQPINSVLRSVNGWFSARKKALDALEGGWTGALNTCRVRASEERQRLLQAAQAAQVRVSEAQAQEAPPEQIQEALVEVKVALVQAAEKSEATEAAYIPRWKFEILDPAALPAEYLCPDEKKIAAVVKALGESAQIPGIRVWNDPVVRPKR